MFAGSLAGGLRVFNALKISELSELSIVMGLLLIAHFRMLYILPFKLCLCGLEASLSELKIVSVR